MFPSCKKTVYFRKNRKARLEFAHAHKNWAIEQWSHILWSDESKFNLRHSDGKKYVKKKKKKKIRETPKHKQLNPSYTRTAFKHGGGKGVMGWGCFTGISGLGPLLQINGIMERFVYRDILE